MGELLKLNVDEGQIEEMLRTELRKRLDHLEHRYTFWDLEELSRQTHMSINFIKDTFFFDPRFKKFRVGRKWLFPAKEAEEFLLLWLSEQSRH
ncbi:group-specific protein [Indiicoccus explosivorum]|uniref:group-specific protein n=1 Tax=Indiicoccus explosivorum TaxID=1917864 RepID=UPI001F4E586D|nr:group-specific protein [Indiicoccus explosivorum]